MQHINKKRALVGLALNVPGFPRIYRAMKPIQKDSVLSARYCYSVWMRHLIQIGQHRRLPRGGIVAELGPGQSLGVGLSAILSGFDRYYAMDINKFTSHQENIAVFEELVRMFRDREDIPSDKEFPRILPKLDDYSFPHHVLSEELLEETLNPERIEQYKKAISVEGREVQYFAPWYDSQVGLQDSADLIVSQAVLEHVQDLEGVYLSLLRWLKEDGMMSHIIGFHSHSYSEKWNGHWTIPATIWRIISRKWGYTINRQGYSKHMQIYKRNNMKVLNEIRYSDKNELTPDMLAKEFCDLSQEDLTTKSLYVLLAK